MKKITFKKAMTVICFGPSLLLSNAMAAGTLDGSTNLICATIEAIGCRGGLCSYGLAKNFELPEFMFVDFNNNTVRQTEQSGGIETSPIDQFKKSEGNLVLQGIENGHGWSMVINSKSGAMTVAIAGDEIIYSVLGACTPEK